MSCRFRLSSQPQFSREAICISLLSLFLVPALARAQQQYQIGELRSGIVKLDVKLDSKPKVTSVVVGDKPQIKIGLLDATNKKTFAVKDFKVTVLVKSTSGETLETREVLINQGTSEASVQLAPASQPGVLEIQVKQPELLEGGTLIGVKPKEKQPPAAAKKPLAKSIRSKVGSLRTFPSLPEVDRPGKNASVLPRYLLAAGDAFNAQMLPASYTLAAMMQEPLASTQRDDLVLKFRRNPPQRKLLADGTDAVSILVSLNQPAPQDITVHLSASGGKLTAKSLMVPKGEFLSEPLEVTSDRAGTVRVHYDSSEPKIALQTPDELEVQFEAPITSVGFSVVPPEIPLIDKADIVVRLYDNNNNPVNSDADREFSFEISSPIGSLEQKAITIKSGRFEGRTSFVPVARGGVSITAFTTGFPKQRADLRVTTPVLLLFLSAIGGLMGGLIAYKVKPESKWRIPLGLVTGFMLYWACLFSLISYIPRLTVLNQVSALALPILGGWLGTEVFTILLKRVGLTT